MAVVLLCCYSPVLGGAERAMLDFAATLETEERWLACPPGPLADAARRAGIRVAPVRARRLESRTGGVRDRVLALARQAGFQRELGALRRALAPDLTVVCGMRAMLAVASVAVVAAARPGAGFGRLVFLHNDLLPPGAAGSAVRQAASRADLVVVPSATVAADLGLPATVVHPGVATERFAGGQSPVSPPEIVVLGAIIGWKRPELALEILARVRETVPDARLRFVGAPLGDAGHALLAELELTAGRLGLSDAVAFVGAVDDPAAELHRASCLLHCAEREPFGLAVAEALAAGRPAVVPAAAGPAEIVARGGGVTYPPGDVAAAAAQVVGLISDPVRAGIVGAYGREQAELRFSAPTARATFLAAVAPLLPARVPPRRSPAWSLVTVTHNSAAELEALLGSVHRHAPDARVVVVDNASGDGTLDVAASWTLRLAVDTVALRENVGFGAANNIGVARVNDPVTALINPDVELIDGSVAALAKRVQAGELLAPLVLGSDGRPQDTAHVFPGSLPARLHAVVPAAALPRVAAAALEPWRSRREREVGWAVGCALVARTETLRRLGPFDDQLFLYGEDLDLGLRARAAGVATRFVPELRVIHHGAHSSSQTFGEEPLERMALARREVITRQLGVGAARLDDRLQALTFLSRAALKLLLGRHPRRERRQLAALRAARRAPSAHPPRQPDDR